MKNNNLEISEETSKRITSLRFLLAVLVVIIHNNYNAIEMQSYSFVFNQSVFGRWFQLLFSNGLATCAVPLFFLFAGYLQAIKNEKYPILLKKKAKTLLLPYILWITIYGLYYTFGMQIAMQFFPNLLGDVNLENAKNNALNWSLLDIFHKVLGYAPNNINPGFAGQFWFVRDLIILTIISPIFNFFIQKKPILFFIFLLFQYFFPINLCFISTFGLFFYNLGLYFAKFKIDFFKMVDKIGWLEILFVFAFLFVYKYKFLVESHVVFAFMILAACTICLKFSLVIVKSQKSFKIAKKLSVFSFWLYAIHMPALIEILKLFWLKFLPMKNGFFCLLEYFGVTILTILISLALGIALKKICPKFFALLCGGR